MSFVESPQLEALRGARKTYYLYILWLQSTGVPARRYYPINGLNVQKEETFYARCEFGDNGLG